MSIFNKPIKSKTSSDWKARTFKAICLSNTWKVIAKINGVDKILEIDPNSISIRYAIILYSSKNNDKYKSFTAKVKQAPIAHDKLDIVSKYWCIFKPNLILPGTVKDNKFVIGKSFYHKGYEYGKE